MNREKLEELRRGFQQDESEPGSKADAQLLVANMLELLDALLEDDEHMSVDEIDKLGRALDEQANSSESPNSSRWSDWIDWHGGEKGPTMTTRWKEDRMTLRDRLAVLDGRTNGSATQAAYGEGV